MKRLSVSSHWTPLAVEELTVLFRPSGLRWWIAGGVAVDLFIGRITGHHSDVDVGFLRCETDKLWEAVSHLYPHLASSLGLELWDGSTPPAAVNDIWLRHPREDTWGAQMMLNPGSRDTWSFRRDPSVLLSMNEALLDSNGIPVLAPHVQLLFKSKDPRPKDEVDAALVMPRLNNAQRRWLGDVLPVDHPWQALLASSGLDSPKRMPSGSDGT